MFGGFLDDIYATLIVKLAYCGSFQLKELWRDEADFEMRARDLDYQDFKRLPREDKTVVRRTLLETIISRSWCLRQPCDATALLTFPSYFRRERSDQPRRTQALVRRT